MQNCENDKSDHQMRKKYFQFQRNEQSEIVSELHQCFWGGLSEVWVKTKITLWFTHIQEGWQEFSRKLVTPKIYFEAVTFPAPALRGSPHSSHNQVLLWDEQACLVKYYFTLQQESQHFPSEFTFTSPSVSPEASQPQHLQLPLDFLRSPWNAELTRTTLLTETTTATITIAEVWMTAVTVKPFQIGEITAL